MNMQDPKYQQKSKSISSPEQDYFALFAMRYPVVQFFKYPWPFYIYTRGIVFWLNIAKLEQQQKTKGHKEQL